MGQNGETMQFRVQVTDRAVTRGIGPTLVEVEGEGGVALLAEQAKATFARNEGSTVEQLEAEGYVWWAVDPLPAPPAPAAPGPEFDDVDTADIDTEEEAA
jgi:hypothetical protein